MGLLIFKYMHLYIYIYFSIKCTCLITKHLLPSTQLIPFSHMLPWKHSRLKFHFSRPTRRSTIASTTLLWYFSYSDRRKENSSHYEMITRCHAEHAQQSLHIFIHILNVRIDFWNLFCCVDLHDTPHQLFMTAYQRKITLKT